MQGATVMSQIAARLASFRGGRAAYFLRAETHWNYGNFPPQFYIMLLPSERDNIAVINI